MAIPEICISYLYFIFLGDPQKIENEISLDKICFGSAKFVKKFEMILLI